MTTFLLDGLDLHRIKTLQSNYTISGIIDDRYSINDWISSHLSSLSLSNVGLISFQGLYDIVLRTINMGCRGPFSHE